jgi:polyhydroxyalkanoate synthesis regulator protein
LVRDGEDVRVIDNNSGEDLTSVTLAQIILEEEKRKKESLPLGTLFQLIRSGGETIRDFVQKSLGTGVGEIQHVKDEIYDHLDKLTKKGAISHDESDKLISSIKKFVESKVKPAVDNVRNIPSVESEVREMKKRLKDLEKKLDTKTKKKKK